MAARICMQLFCMKLCFTSRKQSQIDDFQKGTGPFLKVINLALFSRCEAKFHAEKLHADARCHAPYLPIAKL